MFEQDDFQKMHRFGFGRREIPTDLVFDYCIIIQARDEG